MRLFGYAHPALGKLSPRRGWVEAVELPPGDYAAQYEVRDAPSYPKTAKIDKDHVLFVLEAVELPPGNDAPQYEVRGAPRCFRAAKMTCQVACLKRVHLIMKQLAP